MPRYTHTRDFKGFAFVELASRGDADAAVQGMNGWMPPEGTRRVFFACFTARDKPGGSHYSNAFPMVNTPLGVHATGCLCMLITGTR